MTLAEWPHTSPAERTDELRRISQRWTKDAGAEMAAQVAEYFGGDPPTEDYAPCPGCAGTGTTDLGRHCDCTGLMSGDHQGWERPISGPSLDPPE